MHISNSQHSGGRGWENQDFKSNFSCGVRRYPQRTGDLSQKNKVNEQNNLDSERDNSFDVICP